MFIAQGIDADLANRCFVFEGSTMAFVIAEKLKRQGFGVEILDQRGTSIVEFDPYPYVPLLGLSC